MTVPHTILCRVRYVLDKIGREKKTCILRSVNFPKIMLFMRYVEKYGRARQATDDNIITVQAHCMLDN
jgi:hypothetical protein